MLLCCWWCLRPEAVELDSRRVEHHVLSCEAPASTIAAVSFERWDAQAGGGALPQRSATCCRWKEPPDSFRKTQFVFLSGEGSAVGLVLKAIKCLS